MIQHNRSVRMIQSDVAVIGGGMAGICAAIAAAREGANVVLIQERPVLGGNASSEIRVWTCGAVAMGNNRFAAEGGIVGELDLENLRRNPEGNPHIWSALLLEWVMREKNIRLYLNTTIQQVETRNGAIFSITGFQLGSEQVFCFAARCFIDCTGDGTVGYLAGAHFRTGREGKSRYGEDLAPETDSPYTLGSTILYSIRDTGRPVRYTPPSFAYPRAFIERLLRENDKPLELHTDGCDLWWLEYGGVRDTVGENEEIRLELQRLVYGIWDYVKNSGKFAAENFTLDWVGNIPGKRESRRFVGAYTLTQKDLLEHRCFPDAVCFGGWPVDVHPEQGIYTAEKSCRQTPTGLYQIPLRCLYSENVSNLLFAGRCISVSHVAFASTRVMKTCALTGQAAGTAAALAVHTKKLPAEFSPQDIAALQQRLEEQDVWWCETPAGVSALQCRVQLADSGHRMFRAQEIASYHSMEQDLYILFPQIEYIESISIPICGRKDIVLHAEVFEADAMRNYAGWKKLADLSAVKKSGEWVRLCFDFPIHTDKNLILKLHAIPKAFMGTAREECPGVVGSVGSLRGMKLFHPCFRMEPEPDFYTVREVLKPETRPGTRPHLWVSQKMEKGPAWLELYLDRKLLLQKIALLFNPDLNRDFNNLKPDYYGNGWDKMPQSLVCSFRVLARGEQENWIPLGEVQENNRRRWELPLNFSTDALRLEFCSTYGSAYAQLFAVRLYGKTGIVYCVADDGENSTDPDLKKWDDARSEKPKQLSCL